MPQFVIKSKTAQKWARVDIATKAKGDKPARRKIAWVGIKEATPFCDEKAAKATLAEVADEMRAAARESADRANAAGGRPTRRSDLSNYQQRGEWARAAASIPAEEKKAQLAGNPSAQYAVKHYSLDQAFSQYGKVKFPARPSDFLPQWCFGAGSPDCDMESVAAPDELLSPLEVWFVRSKRGWLGAEGRHLRFFPELHQAMHHFSQEAARDAALKSRSPDCVLVKSQLVVSRVVPMPGARDWDKDDVSAALMCGCEARDIEEAISNVAQERKDAIAASPKRRAAL